MKAFFALTAIAFLLPVPAKAQGYEGLIAAPKQSQYQAVTDKQAGYAGVVTWDDNTGGTAYDPDEANIYNFVARSGAPKDGQQRHAEAQLKAAEERKAKRDAELKERAEAQKKKYAEETAAYEEARRQREESKQEMRGQMDQYQQQVPQGLPY